MDDDSVRAVEAAYESVEQVIRARAAEERVQAGAEDSMYRVAYLLAMAGEWSRAELSAIDHFRRAHQLPTDNRTIPPELDVVASFVDAARRLVGRSGQTAVTA